MNAACAVIKCGDSNTHTPQRKEKSPVLSKAHQNFKWHGTCRDTLHANCHLIHCYLLYRRNQLASCFSVSKRCQLKISNNLYKQKYRQNSLQITWMNGYINVQGRIVH